MGGVRECATTLKNIAKLSSLFWSAEIDFQYLGGARKMTIDFKYDLLCKVRLCVEYTCFSPEYKMLEVSISGWCVLSQPYTENSDTALSGKFWS